MAPIGEDEKWAREEGKWAGEVGKWTGEQGALVHCWSECKRVQPLWKSIRNFLRTNTAASGTTPGNTPKGDPGQHVTEASSSLFAMA